MAQVSEEVAKGSSIPLHRPMSAATSTRSGATGN